MMAEQKDLFGNEVITDPILRDKFIEPPFSVLDTKSGNWQRRKKLWKSIGIKSEIGRDVKVYAIPLKRYKADKMDEEHYGEDAQALNTSIFDPALCEVIYKWFCPDGGEIFDPFAGGSVRGIVANYLGYKYTGVDIRPEQIESNREQGIEILQVNNQPNWYVGDSNIFLDDYRKPCDLLFSCPPYADLEVYSDLEGDISNMDYDDFLEAYREIIFKSCRLIKRGGFAVFVVGDIRDKAGNYRGFVQDTIKAFEYCEMGYYNHAILLNAIASASMRANNTMKNKKLVKVHQDVLVFKKC